MSEYDMIYGIAHEAVVNKNKFYMLSNGIVDCGVQNDIVILGIVPFKKWRVVALSLVTIEPSTANENFVIHFGIQADDDRFGIATFTAANNTLMAYSNFVSVDVLDLIIPDIITPVGEYSIEIAWTEGSPSIYNKWQNEIKIIQCKAISAGITTGQFLPYALVEVDTEGRW